MERIIIMPTFVLVLGCAVVLVESGVLPGLSCPCGYKAYAGEDSTFSNCCKGECPTLKEWTNYDAICTMEPESFRQLTKCGAGCDNDDSSLISSFFHAPSMATPAPSASPTRAPSIAPTPFPTHFPTYHKHVAIRHRHRQVCAANFHTRVGGSVCCHQRGRVLHKRHICNKAAPYCNDFVQGSHMGHCITAASYRNELRKKRAIAAAWMSHGGNSSPALQNLLKHFLRPNVRQGFQRAVVCQQHLRHFCRTNFVIRMIHHRQKVSTCGQTSRPG
jgi:hypothetical protein